MPSLLSLLIVSSGAKGVTSHFIQFFMLAVIVTQRVSTVDRALMGLLSRKGNRNILPFVFIHFRKG
jgi:hypothetical protein